MVFNWKQVLCNDNVCRDERIPSDLIKQETDTTRSPPLCPNLDLGLAIHPQKRGINQEIVPKVPIKIAMKKPTSEISVVLPLFVCEVPFCWQDRIKCIWVSNPRVLKYPIFHHIHSHLHLCHQFQTQQTLHWRLVTFTSRYIGRFQSVTALLLLSYRIVTSLLLANHQ